MADRFNVLLVGHGRLGQLIEAAAPQAGATIVGIIDDRNVADLGDRDRWRDVDLRPARSIGELADVGVVDGAGDGRPDRRRVGRDQLAEASVADEQDVEAVGHVSTPPGCAACGAAVRPRPTAADRRP